MSQHTRYECIHGSVLSQCQCDSKDKTVTIEACPVWCPENTETNEDIFRRMDTSRMSPDLAAQVERIRERGA